MEQFALGPRGKRPVVFTSLRHEQVEEALAIPAVGSLGSDAVSCSWDAAPEVARALGLSMPAMPDFDVPFPGFDRYKALGLDRRLREYQKDDLIFLARLAAGINAEPCRTGKTPTMLALSILVGARKTLIVAPASAEPGWIRHVASWTGEPALRLLGRRGDETRLFCMTCMGRAWVLVDGERHRCHGCVAENGSTYGYNLYRGTAVFDAIEAAQYVIVGYDNLIPQHRRGDKGERTVRIDLPGWAPTLARYTFDLVLLDECHNLRGFKGATDKKLIGKSRWSKVHDLTKKVPRVYGISATPIFGDESDLWAQLAIIFGTGTYGRKPWTFFKRYSGMTSTKYGWELTGATNVDELVRRNSHFILKRPDSEVRAGMPPKQRQIVEVEIDAGKSKIDIETMSKRTAIAQALGATAKLKIPIAIEHVAESLLSEQKVVIFTFLRETARLFVEKLREELMKLPRARYDKIKVWHVDGAVNADVRDAQAVAFSEFDGPGVFVATVDSMQVGISLKNARMVGYLELHWNPSALLQSEDRAYELGTKGLTVVYFVAKDTIDEDVIDVVMPKMEAVDKVMQEGAAADFTAAFAKNEKADVNELWRRMLDARGLEPTDDDEGLPCLP